MYRIGQKYKIETSSGIYYTGTVVSEDNFAIHIHTIRNEEIILNKSDIRRSKAEQDRTVMGIEAQKERIDR